MDLAVRHPIIEDVFERWNLGEAARPYRGHAYRVYNFARRLVGGSRHDDELAVASAFHDIGIWTDGTFDYLPPSTARARDYVHQRLPHLSSSRVGELIENHHVLFRIRSGASADLLEAFRLADRVDVSRGLLAAGLDRGFLRDVEAAFPYAGFHGMLLRTALRWMARHPLRPLPMLRSTRRTRG